MAEKHPELAVTFMKGMIKVGRWANEHKHAAAAILDKQTYYQDVEDTYEGIKEIDLVPNLSPQNLASMMYWIRLDRIGFNPINHHASAAYRQECGPAGREIGNDQDGAKHA